jgi:anti-sigma factor RsiW
MAVHDNDIDLLYSYLDGELPVPECEGLWRRLAVEPELTAELDRLRSEHALRQEVWGACEPTDQAVALTENRVLRAARRHDWMSTGNHMLRVLTGAAALIAVGFGFGWSGRNHANSVAQVNAPFVQQQQAGSGKFLVSLRDDTGRVVQIPFDSLDEASHFADDLEQSQRNRQAAESPAVVPAMERF